MKHHALNSFGGPGVRTRSCLRVAPLAGFFLLALIGNVIGGVAFVAGLNYAQVSLE